MKVDHRTVLGSVGCAARPRSAVATARAATLLVVLSVVAPQACATAVRPESGPPPQTAAAAPPRAVEPVAHELELPDAGPGSGAVVADGASAAAADEAPAEAAADEARSEAAAVDELAAQDEALELELDDRPTSFPDPFESVNRRTLRLNQTVDRWVVAPVADAYGYAVPDRAKRSVRDFLANLESPAIFVNDVLQGELGHAATTVARFSINTVFGLAGLFDPATAMGLDRHTSDFGQTLARNGFGSGPFLIVPLLGPTTVRDGIGTLVDIALQPTIYLLGPAPLVVASVQEGTVGLTMREHHGQDLKRLEQASLDYYASLRSAYYQDRMAKLGMPLSVGESALAGRDAPEGEVARATPALPPT